MPTVHYSGYVFSPIPFSIKTGPSTITSPNGRRFVFRVHIEGGRAVAACETDPADRDAVDQGLQIAYSLTRMALAIRALATGHSVEVIYYNARIEGGGDSPDLCQTARTCSNKELFFRRRLHNGVQFGWVG